MKITQQLYVFSLSSNEDRCDTIITQYSHGRNKCKQQTNTVSKRKVYLWILPWYTKRKWCWCCCCTKVDVVAGITQDILCKTKSFVSWIKLFLLCLPFCRYLLSNSIDEINTWFFKYELIKNSLCLFVTVSCEKVLFHFINNKIIWQSIYENGWYKI